MGIQERFLHFHDTIRLDYESNAGLREKRDRILRKLDGLGRSRYRTFNQGSYAIGTGVRPVDGDYDIDVGLALRLDPTGADPVKVKRWVHEVFDGHTKRVQIRRHCVTVFYAAFKNNPPYHVDFAIYAEDDDRDLHLAVGKANSRDDHREWRRSEPQALVELLKNHLEGDDRSQFRRVVRYLKRWKEGNFPKTGKAAPTGIALTLLCREHLQVQPGDDFVATYSVFDGARQGFRRWISHGFTRRLSAELPVEPGADVLERMSDAQMAAFETKLVQACSTMEAVASSGPATATRLFQSLFGSDFPAR